MIVTKTPKEIIVSGTDDFDVPSTLNCGQIFRYTIDGNVATVYSRDHRCTIEFDSSKAILRADDLDYFYHFFDFDRDYAKIKSALKQDAFLKDAVNYGHGIRILNNDAFEMLVSFIISANNNIGRIKKSIEYLCSHFGKNMGDYFAFPTLDALKTCTEEDFRSAGLGYRAPQMLSTIGKLSASDISALKTMDKQAQFDFLISLPGVGEKVANCILLFGLHVKDVFPVDTWINKVYNKLTGTDTRDRKKITRELSARYGELSGFAQQYFFYYFRDNKIK